MTQYKECENLIQSLLSKQSLNAYVAQFPSKYDLNST